MRGRIGDVSHPSPQDLVDHPFLDGFEVQVLCQHPFDAPEPPPVVPAQDQLPPDHAVDRPERRRVDHAHVDRQAKTTSS